MIKEIMDLACVPYDEPCAQIDNPDYQDKAVKECQSYIRQLKRVFGEPPDGARLKLRYNPHDLGTYLSVVCEYSRMMPDAVAYAFKCEAEGPAKWDAEAMAELGLVTAS